MEWAEKHGSAQLGQFRPVMGFAAFQSGWLL
jgi:uncharacterized protein (DUF885 family)